MMLLLNHVYPFICENNAYAHQSVQLLTLQSLKLYDLNDIPILFHLNENMIIIWPETCFTEKQVSEH